MINNAHINIHTTLPIICIVHAIVCGIFVIVNNPKRKLNQIFLGICISFIGWFSFYLPYIFDCSEDLLIKWYRISYCFICFVPITTYTFITTYLECDNNNFWFKINSIIGITLSTLSITTSWIVDKTNYLPWFPYPQAGKLHPLLIIHCLSLAYLAIKNNIIVLNNPQTSPNKRIHVKYLLISIATLSIGALDFLNNYNVTIYPIGPIAASGYLLISTLAIIKHQLMDIKVIIRKSLIYSLLIIIIAIFYFLSIYFTEHALEKTLGYRSVFISLFFAIVIATLFMPIKNFIEKFLFEKDLGLIAEENELLRKEIIQVEKLKCISIFASGMAHEIKNPLTVIKTFSEYLPKKIHDREFLNKFCQIINQEVTRIDNLVHDLLEFSKPSPPVLRKLDIHALLNTTLELLNNEFIKHHIKVQKNFIAPHDLHLSLDSNQIKQSFLNIFLNAVEAMPNGGQLDIKTAIMEVSNKLIIKIQDSGLGIPAKDLPYIFDPFFTNKDHGTGLGLSITHEIIKNHQGKIYVESTEGKGATFILELPL